MEALAEKESQITNSSNVQFLNQTEEKGEIYLFKSNEDAQEAVKSIETSHLRSRKNLQVAVVDNTEDSSFVVDIEKLTDIYEKVIFVSNDDNFELNEISEISSKANRIVYQSFSKYIIDNLAVMRNAHSVIYHYINNNKLSDIFGKKLQAFDYIWGSDEKDESRTTYFIYKNVIIKLWIEEKMCHQIGYFKILTNYTFKITKIKTYWDNEISDKQDLEIEITDFEGRTYTANLNGKDRYKLDAFRNVLRPIGNFVDDFKPLEFKQIFNQLYLESTPVEYDIIRNPGFIEDRNIYLTANEVINLEN